jgi:ornithine cyclodeaminase
VSRDVARSPVDQLVRSAVHMSTRAATPALWITEADVTALLDVHAAIAAVEGALRAEAGGAAQNLLKTYIAWGSGGTLHALGGALPASGVVGSKTWAHTAGGATPLLVLFDATTGGLCAVIEAFALGQLRTGATAGVATRWLAAEDASTFALIGSGKQAMAQVAAVLAVRPGCTVRVFSPTAAHREALAARVREVFAVEASAAASLGEAVDGAAIVTLATRARTPFLYARALARGTHVNAIGAITPDRAELAGDVFDRCSVVAADSVPAVQQLSREFREYYGGREWTAVVPLSQVVGELRRRRPDTDLTLFKAMGAGLADVAVGVEVLERARRAGRGRRLEQPVPAEIDWGRRELRPPAARCADADERRK